jgi:hypothetical protein
MAGNQELDWGRWGLLTSWRLLRGVGARKQMDLRQGFAHLLRRQGLYPCYPFGIWKPEVRSQIRAHRGFPQWRPVLRTLDLAARPLHLARLVPKYQFQFRRANPWVRWFPKSSALTGRVSVTGASRTPGGAQPRTAPSAAMGAAGVIARRHSPLSLSAWHRGQVNDNG